MFFTLKELSSTSVRSKVRADKNLIAKFGWYLPLPTGEEKFQTETQLKVRNFGERSIFFLRSNCEI